ncbi:CsgG/HfaB family protein [Pontiella sp.]|uniref:CsgG/HfaB family protein n=1 Tax=Pontiella sp. TaxID=2837462 RepID=UPI003562E316
MKSHLLLSTVAGGMSLLLIAGCYSSKITKEEEAVTPGWSSARPPLPLAERKKIAVLDFEDQTDYGSGRIGRSAASVLTTYLDRSGQFSLYEREKLNRIVEEQKLTGNAVGAEVAASVGKRAGLDFVVIGTVSSFGYKTVRSQAIIFGSKVKRQAEATVDVRLVEVATGRIIAAESGRGIAQATSGKVLGVGTSAGYDETMAGNALRAAISKFADKLIDQSLDKR